MIIYNPNIYILFHSARRGEAVFMKTATIYKATNKIAKVFDGNMNSNYTSYDGLDMVKCDKVNHGTYKIYLNDEKTVYNNMLHIYARDKKDLIEVNATFNYSKLSDLEKIWCLAYIDQNNMVCSKQLNNMVVSMYIDKNDTPNNFSYLSQLFKTLCHNVETRYSLVDYNDKGKKTIESLNDYHSIVKSLQERYRQSVTNNIYLIKI